MVKTSRMKLRDSQYYRTDILLHIFFKKKRCLSFFKKDMLRWRKAELPLHGWKIANPRKNIRKKKVIAVSYGNTALLYKFVI